MGACPNGYVCDPIKKNCAKNGHSLTCRGCELVVNQVISRGCAQACDVLGVAEAICKFIIKRAHVCQKIIHWTLHGLSPFTICAELGLCSSGTCKCGYCTTYLENRCLSLPNHCPAHNNNNNNLWSNEVSCKIKSNVCFSLNINTRYLVNTTFVEKDEKELGVCLDHKCDNSHMGCCLSCF
jgi:hypothetical protein